MTQPKEIDAGLSLLDRQVLDVEGIPVGKVDDLELSDDAAADGEGPRIEALLLGPVAYGRRIGGRLGAWISGIGARLSHGEGPISVPIEVVKEVEVSVTLGVRADELPRVGDLDAWLQEHLIARIPGADRASQ